MRYLILAILFSFNSYADNYPDPKNVKHPTDEEIQKLDYGEAPKNHEALFKKFILKNLKDPDSAKFENIKKPIKMWGSSLGIIHYWLICGEVNAKNSFGGYTGMKPMGIRIYPITNEVKLEILDENGSVKFTYAKLRNPCD